MLPVRTGTILNNIIEQYIEQALPVPSQGIAARAKLEVSPATIRNEMAHLEQEGYIMRPHTSAGSVPTDKGYRHYVESLENVTLSPTKQRLIGHLFHQVETESEKWLSLAATILAQLVHNMTVVTMAKPIKCKFKHMEIVALQDSLALLILVLPGAKVKQRMITFAQAVPQTELTIIANKLNTAYTGLTGRQILDKELEFSPLEKLITDHLAEIMQTEDEQEYEEPHFDGWHFILNQPEFSHSQRIQALMELVEHRNLLKIISPAGVKSSAVHVIIGKENKLAAIHDYSIVISQYGLPEEAIGTIGVVGPTRMPYSDTIPTVNYLAMVLSKMVAGLFGR